jgi:hypothetical protein
MLLNIKLARLFPKIVLIRKEHHLITRSCLDTLDSSHLLADPAQRLKVQRTALTLMKQAFAPHDKQPSRPERVFVDSQDDMLLINGESVPKSRLKSRKRSPG